MNIIETIRAEIERLKKQLVRGACASQVQFETTCKEEAYNEVLAKLDTLKEQPVDTSEDEKIRQGLISYLKADMEYNPSQSPSFYTEALAYLARQSKEQPVCEGLEEEIARMWAKSCHLNEKKDQRIATLTSIEFEELARHFAQWGAEHAKEELMKEAVEGEVCGKLSDHLNIRHSSEVETPDKLTRIFCNTDGFKVGDKVKLIIIKEDTK